MRRFVFVMIVIGLGIGVVAVAMTLLSAQTATQTPTPQPLATTSSEALLSPTSTEVACTLLDVDMDAAPDLHLALAIDSMYEEMPLFQTPVAVVVTQEKPFNVGCIEAGD